MCGEFSWLEVGLLYLLLLSINSSGGAVRYLVCLAQSMLALKCKQLAQSTPSEVEGWFCLMECCAPSDLKYGWIALLGLSPLELCLNQFFSLITFLSSALW